VQGLNDFEAAEKKWPGLVQKFITQRVPFTAFEKGLSQHTPNEIKVVVDWSKPS
jgi:hypothetical protein